MLKKLGWIIALHVVLGLLSANGALSANFGKISGQVTDAETGEPLIGANVIVLTNNTSDLEQIVESTTYGAATDLGGNFTVLQVPPGEYRVRADYIGYRSVVIEDVQVRTDRISFVDFEMEPSVLEGEEVVVLGERAIIEKDIAATQRTVSAADIENLPATSIGEVLQTQAGVVSSGGLHFRGGRSGEVVYYMDGVPLSNPLFSEIDAGEVINQDVISEMQVISGTYSAEYGNAMSGIINITTREGDDHFRLNLSSKYSIETGDAPGVWEWNADTNSYQPGSYAYNRSVSRASVSGPLIPQKTHFQLSFSYDDRDSYLPWGYNTEQNIFTKITDRHIDNLKLSVAVNYAKGERKSYSHDWLRIEDQYKAEPETESQMMQLGLVHTLTPNLYYNLSLYYNGHKSNSGDYDWRTLTPDYRLDANQEFALEDDVGSYSEDDQQTLGLKMDAVWQANSHHEFKAGFEARQHTLDSFYIGTPYYTDHLLDDYSKEPREFAAYIQDKINFSTIILSAGLRFDLTDPNSDFWPSPYDAYYNRDENYQSADVHTQLSPRLAISYPVTDQSVFFFGYGHYFQRPEYQYLYVTQTDDNYDENIVMNLRSGNGIFGNPNLKPEKTIAYEFGVSQQLWTQYLLNVSVYFKKITNLVGARTYFAGNEPGVFETYSLHINEDFASNNGFEIQFRKRQGHYLTGEINYTYSVAEGSSSAPWQRVGSEEENLQTLKFFPLDFDQRHTINANLRLHFDERKGPQLAGFHPLQNSSFSLLFRYGSGLPYTKGQRGATQPYEINNERMPATWTLDLLIDREFNFGSLKVIPFLDIYNLTNRENVLYVDPFTGEPDDLLGDGETEAYAANPLNWDNPRIIYLGVNVRY